MAKNDIGPNASVVNTAAQAQGNLAALSIFRGQGIYLPRHALDKYRSSYFGTCLGKNDTNILVFGDSTAVGRHAGTTNSGYDGARPKSLFVQMGNRMRSKHAAPTSMASILGSSGLDTNFGTYDTRLVQGSGWAPVALSTQQSFGGEPFANSTTTNAWSFTPPETWDRADVICIGQSGYDTLTFKADGSNVGSFTGNQATAALYKTTINAASLKAQTLDIVRTGVGTSGKVVGVLCRSSSDSRVNIMVSAKGGQKVSYWTPVSDARNALPNLALLSPKLVIISLTINDWNAGTSLSQFETDTQTLITYAKNAGADVLLLIGNPSATPGYGYADAATQNSYAQVYYKLAIANQCALVDQIAIFNSYALAKARGDYLTDDSDPLHLSDQGQYVMADILSDVLCLAA